MSLKYQYCPLKYEGGHQGVRMDTKIIISNRSQNISMNLQINNEVLKYLMMVPNYPTVSGRFSRYLDETTKYQDGLQNIIIFTKILRCFTNYPVTPWKSISVCRHGVIKMVTCYFRVQISFIAFLGFLGTNTTKIIGCNFFYFYVPKATKKDKICPIFLVPLYFRF